MKAKQLKMYHEFNRHFDNVFNGYFEIVLAPIWGLCRLFRWDVDKNTSLLIALVWGGVIVPILALSGIAVLIWQVIK